MIPETTDMPQKADCNPHLSLCLQVIDLDSPFFFGVGRDMTDEERKNAEKHGRYDNPPMSVLGVTREGLAAVDGKELAQLFVASPQILAALQRLEKACVAVHEVSGGTLQHQALWLAQLEARDAITAATGIPWQNAERVDTPGGLRDAAWEEVTKEVFDQFLAAYPRPLEQDITSICEPPMLTYNDFSEGKAWPAICCRESEALRRVRISWGAWSCLFSAK